MKAPTVQRGTRITARLWNELAGAVNGAIQAPEDLDSGITEDEVTQSTRVWRENSRTSVEVRVENPEDSEQYVDVARALQSGLIDGASGESITIVWLNSG